jgi:hypothetical protein
VATALPSLTELCLPGAVRFSALKAPAYSRHSLSARPVSGNRTRRPCTAIASRAALNRELTTRVAACMDHIRNVDDLVLQLTGPGAVEFIAGWKKARIVVDAGSGPGEEEPPAPLPTPPAP